MVRKLITLIILLFLTNFTFSQIDDNSESNRKCDNYISAPPERASPIFDKNFPKNDIEKLYEFISENLQYPETAKADKIEGRVFVEFWIDTNGFTSEHKVILSVRQDLDEEALRVAKLIKYDIPAMYMDKQPIGMCYSFVFRFTLKEDKPSRNCLKSSENGKPKHKNKKKNSNDNK